MARWPRLLVAADTVRERRVIHLALCAGLRKAELRGLQGRHVRRDGFVWVSADIAKGGKVRRVPIIVDLEVTIAEICESVDRREYVIPSRHVIELPYNRTWRRPRTGRARGRRCGGVIGVVERAGIATRIHPHLLRHAFGDHIARHAGLRVAQAMLGHESVERPSRPMSASPRSTSSRLPSPASR